MAKKKIAALLIAAVVAAGGWALPARVSAAENDGTAVTWQQDETESSEQNSDEGSGSAGAERYFGKRDAGCYDSR